MFLEILQEQRNGIIGLTEKYGARNVRVFESVAGDEECATSDVDIPVTLPGGYNMYLQRISL